MYSTDNGGDVKVCSYACLWPVVWNYIVVRISLVGTLATISQFMNFAMHTPEKTNRERGKYQTRSPRAVYLTQGSYSFELFKFHDFFHDIF